MRRVAAIDLVRDESVASGAGREGAPCQVEYLMKISDGTRARMRA